MKELINLLNKLVNLKVVELAHFYSIGISCGKIHLQGHYNADVVKLYIERIKLKSEITQNGYVELTKKKVRFVFT